MNLQALFTQAAGLHQQGKLAEAERLYQQLLELDPANGPGRHLLGVLRSQQGRNAEAIELIGGALQANPNDIGARLNYSLVLQRTGQTQEALASYDNVLALRPDFPEAQFNRGVLLLELKRFGDAMASFDRALALRPNYVEAHFNLGVALSETGRFPQALASYDKALQFNPRMANALDNRGNALRELKRYDEALASYDSALAIDPNAGSAHYNRGVVLSDLKRYAEALAAYKTALALKSDFAPAHFNLAVALDAMKRFDEALSSYDRALAINPSYVEALNNRGVALWNLGRHDEALESFDRAVAANPAFAGAWSNRAGMLYQRRQLGHALASFDRVIALEPGNASAWNGRGSALRQMKRTDEARVAFDKAVTLDPNYAEALANRAILHWDDNQHYDDAVADLVRVCTIDPDYPYARGELLHLRMQGCDWRDFGAEVARIDEAVRAGKRVVRPFVYQAASQSPADLMACSKIFANDAFPTATPLPVKVNRGHDKIRIGYVSGEFRDQATAHLMAGLYEHHDKTRFKLIALDTGWQDNGPMRQRLEAAFDKFVDLSKLSDEDAARAVLAEEIDILVNLGGYFGDQRMGVFAHRPAPIQVNYLGFPATLGASYIDYIVADRIVIPDDERRFYTENVVWLPDTYQANDSKRPIAETGASRADAGLPDNGFVFCNFNQSYKLTPDIFAAWMCILKQVPGSVLWLWHSKNETTANLRREAVRAGVAAERLIFGQGLPQAEHLARLKLADLFLDSLPYNAHTTASDALWSGVPLLTCLGKTFPGRVAASLLHAAGLPELVTQTMADYEARAVALAKDEAQLKALRDRLEKNRQSCALFDTDLFRRNMEAAYSKMWDICLRGEAPHSFGV